MVFTAPTTAMFPLPSLFLPSFLPSFLPPSLTCLLSSQYLSISPRIGENNSCRVRISVESGWTWELKQGSEKKCNEMNVYLHLPRYVGAPNTTKLISSKPVYLDLYVLTCPLTGTTVSTAREASLPTPVVGDTASRRTRRRRPEALTTPASSI